MAEEAPPPRPKRSSAPLAAGVALLLGVPLAGLALKAWGPLLFAPDEAPRPVVEITGPRKLDIPAAASPEARASSIELVRGEGRAPTAAAAPPAAAPGPSPAPAPAEQEPKAPEPPAQAPLVQQAPKKGFPKLRPNQGWKSWFVRQGLPSGVPDPVEPKDQPQEPKSEPKQAAPSPAAAATAPPAVSPAPPKAAKPSRQGYKPPAPSYSAVDQANQVSAGAGLGTADTAAAPAVASQPPKRVWTEHTTIVAPPDAAPQPNPEKPRADGACGRRGWWKSPATGLCYFSHASCAATEYNGPGCFQPNP